MLLWCQSVRRAVACGPCMNNSTHVIDIRRQGCISSSNHQTEHSSPLSQIAQRRSRTGQQLSPLQMQLMPYNVWPRTLSRAIWFMQGDVLKAQLADAYILHVM